MTVEADSLPRGRKRKKVRPQQPPPSLPREKRAIAKAQPVVGVPAGWRVIARKEFADHLLSARFLVLTILLGLIAAVAVYATAGAIREAAVTATGTPALFLNLYTYQPPNGQIPPFVALFAFVAPLLGIAFGFDGVNGERSEGTLPRLLAQPIHRDDVVNGKFVAGLAAISVIFIAITALVAAIGIIQLGVLPQPEDVLRLMVWGILSVVFVGFWLAFALLCSVVMRRAATSALAAIGVWLVVTLFAALVVGLIANVVAPIPADAGAGSPEAVTNIYVQQQLSRISPNQLFNEATAALLDPGTRTLSPGLVTPGQADRAIPSILSFDQSLLVIWPQFVALIALTAVAFALAYVSFMRQEVRA